MSAQQPQLDELAALAELLNHGQLQEAEQRAVHLLQAHPRLGVLWKMLSVAQLRQGKDGIEALRRAAELLPTDAEVHANLGGALRDRQEWEPALASLRQALTLDPRNHQAMLDAGDVQRALGRAQEALALYHWAVQIEPRSSEGYHGLGNAFLDTGQAAEAVRCYSKALERGLKDPAVFANLGNALRQLGRFEEAAVASRAALQRAPRLAAAHNNLGLSLAGMGQRAQAIECYREALQHDARYVEACNNLGTALVQEGAFSEASRCFQRSIDLEPQRAVSHAHLGHALLNLRRVEEAVECFRAALAADAGCIGAHTGLAAALRLQRLPAEAQASCEAALALAPGRADVLALFGELRADQGDFAMAQESFRRAIATDPNCVQAYASIAAHQRMSLDDTAWLQGVRSLLSRPLSANEQIHLQYALGKYHDDVGEYPQAFAAFRDANELSKRLGGRYDAQGLTALVDRLTQLGSEPFVQQYRAHALRTRVPIFIIGMPRSGTSLIEQILASHPAVFGAGEIRFWDRRFAGLSQSDLPQIEHELASAARDYLELLHTQAPQAERVTDKMPANFLYAGLIHAALPGARFIHMQRHPLDTCLSVYFQNFFSVSPYARDLHDLAHYFREYRRSMQHWSRVLPDGVLLEVPYEGLVEDLEGWTRRVLDFLGLPWDARCLAFHDTPRTVLTASKWQVRQQVNRRSVGRWRNYQQYLGPLKQLVAD